MTCTINKVDIKAKFINQKFDKVRQNGGVLKEMFVEYRLKNIKLKGVFIMEKVKKQFVYFLALVLVWSTFNIAFNHREYINDDQPAAIIALIASGGDISKAGEGALGGLITGLTVDVEELAPAFTAAAAGASVAEVAGILVGIMGVAAGIGAVFAIAA